MPTRGRKNNKSKVEKLVSSVAGVTGVRGLSGVSGVPGVLGVSGVSGASGKDPCPEFAVMSCATCSMIQRARALTRLCVRAESAGLELPGLAAPGCSCARIARQLSDMKAVEQDRRHEAKK